MHGAESLHLPRQWIAVERMTSLRRCTAAGCRQSRSLCINGSVLSRGACGMGMQLVIGDNRYHWTWQMQ